MEMFFCIVFSKKQTLEDKVTTASSAIPAGFVHELLSAAVMVLLLKVNKPHPAHLHKE